MTATIYARIDANLKEATDIYAEDHGMSLASAVADLLSRGLEAYSGAASIQQLEERVRELDREMTRVRDTTATMDQRLKQVLGTCQCGSRLSGYDFLITGRCPKCSTGVASLLAGGGDPSAGSLNRNELGPFMSGIGVAIALLILAYAATKE
jgi:antitoxin component of RelBE/YafQ-DinJ toxin-antitoxin module